MKNAILRNVKNWRGSGQGEAEGRPGPGRRRMGSEEAQMGDWEGLRRNGKEPPGWALGVWLAYERGQPRPGFEWEQVDLVYTLGACFLPHSCNFLQIQRPEWCWEIGKNN